MVRFIAETIGVALVALAIVLGFSLAYHSPVHPVDNSVPQGIEVANVGSSHGQYGFNYADEGKYVTHNFGMMSQSFWYDCSLVDYYSDSFADGAVLFLPVSYFSLWYDELGDPQYQVKNERYYTILDLDHIRDDGFLHRVTHGYFRLLLVPDSWIGKVFKPVASKGSSSSKSRSREEIGKWKATTHITDYKIQDEEGNALPMLDENVEMLEKLIEECQEHGIVPVIVTTPYLDYYSRWFSDDFQRYFHEQVDAIATKYGVEFWDYSKDERFSQSEDLFKDTDHLNTDGAKLFTSVCFERLIEEGLIEAR